MKSVIVELDPSLLQQEDKMLQLFEQLDSIGFHRDINYGIVHIPGKEEMACIRGELEESRRIAIKAVPGVLEVWSDEPIKPVSSSSAVGPGRRPRPRRR